MAFVTCSQHKKSQDAQDEKIKELEKNALTAEGALVDGNQVTVAKIKEAIAGDVEVSVKPNSGIKGKGTKADPLALNLGDTLTLGEDGKLNANIEQPEVGESLVGNGLTYDERTKQLNVKTARIVDAAGRVIGYGVNQGA